MVGICVTVTRRRAAISMTRTARHCACGVVHTPHTHTHTSQRLSAHTPAVLQPPRRPQVLTTTGPRRHRPGALTHSAHIHASATALQCIGCQPRHPRTTYTRNTCIFRALHSDQVLLRNRTQVIEAQ